MRGLSCLTLLVVLAGLTGCSTLDIHDVKETSVEGRWLGATIEPGALGPTINNLSKLRFNGAPIALGTKPTTIKTDKALVLGLQNQNGTRYDATGLLIGPNPGASEGDANFVCDGALAPARIENGWGYVVGNWRLARCRRAQATALWITEGPGDCDTLRAEYDPNVHILFVADGDTDRVYAVYGQIQVYVDADPTHARTVKEGEYIEIDATTGVVKTEPTGISYLFDGIYNNARNCAKAVGLP